MPTTRATSFPPIQGRGSASSGSQGSRTPSTPPLPLVAGALAPPTTSATTATANKKGRPASKGKAAARVMAPSASGEEELLLLKSLLRGQSSRLTTKAAHGGRRTSTTSASTVGGSLSSLGPAPGPEGKVPRPPATTANSAPSTPPPPPPAFMSTGKKAASPEGTVRSGSEYYVAPEERRAEAAVLQRPIPSSGTATEGDATTAATLAAAAAAHLLDPATPAAEEERQLMRDFENRQRRMNDRLKAQRANWADPPPSAGAIAPAEPRVLTAATEEDVREKAAAAEDFAKSQAKLKRRLDAAAARRTASAAGPDDGQPAAPSPAGDDDDESAGSGSCVGSFNFFGEDGGDVVPDPRDEAPVGEGGPLPPQGRSRASPAGSAGPRRRHSNHRGRPAHAASPARSVSHESSPDPWPVRQGSASDPSLVSLTLGRMSMASCSIARVTDGARAVMEMLANRPDVFLPSPSETGIVRTGDVLSAKHILKLDLQDALRSRSGPTGIIAGAPYFRIVPKLNIAGVAQANISAIRTIVNELRRAYIEGPVIWVNLREEPLVYINNQAHIVRERQNPLKPVIIPNVTGRSIEAIEAKLKEEVLQEAYESGGNVSVHVEGKDMLVEDQWECADSHTVYTPKEVFQHLATRSSTATGALHYFRRPITQNIGPTPADFDFVLDACIEEPKAVFVFNCQTGRGRTSAMMQIANIVRFYQLCVKDISVDVRVLRGSTNTPTFRTIQKLVSLFPDGKLHERRLNILMDLADKVYSMADHIIEAFSDMEENPPEEAVMRLQLYALFLVFSYYCEQRLWNYAVRTAFAQWLEENPDLNVLIHSVRDKLKDQLKAEQIITAGPSHTAFSSAGAGAEARAGSMSGGPGEPSLLASLDPPEVARAIRHRHGNVLSAGRILCSVPMGAAQHTVRALRQVAPDLPIFTSGRMSSIARAGLVRDIRASFPGRNRLHWLSLRAEPMVIVNDVSYTLTDSNAPLHMTENGATMHVSVQAIEQIEDRLRRDVLLEAQEHGGYVLVHHLDETGSRTCRRLKVCSVRTPKSTMEDFAVTCNVTYNRVPLPFSGQMLASDIDPLLRFFDESDIDPHDAIVINDSEGSTRTSVALNMLMLHRAARLCDLRSAKSTADFVQVLRVGSLDQVVPSAHLPASLPVEADEVPDAPVEPLLASTICQMLTAGSLLRTVDAAIALSGRGIHYNILHRFSYLKNKISLVGVNKPQRIVDALHCLRCYLLVLLTSLYLDDPYAAASGSFSHWVREHTEVCNIIDNLDRRGEAAVKCVTSDNLMKADVSRRAGEVLTANFCLKADHFPGCQKKGLHPELCGAPNFRKVNLVNVYGVAIPTLLGVHNILSILGATNEPLTTYPGQSNDREAFLGFAAPRLFDPTFKPEELQRPLRGSVVWVNLREEPILYVGDRPFVFRDLATPYVNVELTGIPTDKIEFVETRLKADVLAEAAQYDGRFLVHDEGNPGELVGQWELASEATVKTLREVYEELEENGARCQMLRLPVTDEQSPDIRDFDHLVAALLPRITEHLDRRETLSFVFNCQMGRGRTTTGMVVCCLLIGLVMPEYYEEMHTTHDPLYPDYESDLWRGDYEVITQLKRVLTQGRVAKYKVDLVLEECSKMQNLRVAIESFAIAERSPDNTEQSRMRAHHAGVHYLLRYFNIVVFAVYLEEAYDKMRKRMRSSFVDWMAQHPELPALSATAALK